MTTQYKNLINGQLVDNGKWIDVVNPATEQVIGQVPDCGQADLDKAVAAATRRAVGQQWLFQRNTPDADISALYAVTLAWHYATTKSKAAAKPRAAIY